ncbi:MAG: ClbS/DfsB family four-helix bundle protein [Chloroflexota bacterium]|nr:ClbS/DfsB family four-helix bundle protein [Chloroflexota bacterium]
MADDLRRAIIDEHEQYHATVAGLDQTTLESEPVLGSWPVRDLTAHLTGWIDTLLATAAHGLGGPAPEHTTIGDFDAFNAANVEAAGDKEWPAVLSELDAAVERAVGQVATLTDDQLAVEMDFPWGQHGAISRLLAIIPHHHHEHREDVEKWLAARNQ